MFRKRREKYRNKNNETNENSAVLLVVFFSPVVSITMFIWNLFTMFFHPVAVLIGVTLCARRVDLPSALAADDQMMVRVPFEQCDSKLNTLAFMPHKYLQISNYSAAAAGKRKQILIQSGSQKCLIRRKSKDLPKFPRLIAFIRCTSVIYRRHLFIWQNAKGEFRACSKKHTHTHEWSRHSCVEWFCWWIHYVKRNCIE